MLSDKAQCSRANVYIKIPAMSKTDKTAEK